MAPGKVYLKQKARERSKRLKKEAERKKKPNTLKRVDKPLTSEYEYQKTRKEINATNRRRSKDMERRVARYLKGLRVPASGAMMGMKGDCYIPLATGGQYLIECKLSAAKDRQDKPRMTLDMKWFSKIINDYRAMNMHFGILVIHYHGLKEDYVFVPPSGMRLIAMHSTHGLTVDLIRHEVKPVDLVEFNGKPRAVYSILQEKLEEHFITVNGFKAAAFILSSGLWYIFKLSEFRDIMEGV